MPESIITSRQNPVVAQFRAAARNEGHWMLLEGRHLLDEALAAGAAIDLVAASADRIATHELDLLRRAVGADRVVVVAGAVLEAMSPARTPGGVVALAARPHHSLATVIAGTMPLVIVAVEIQDPGNLGAMVRAVEAGGATGMLTTPGTADPFGWKALRGAMGSSFRLPIAAVDSVEEAVIEAHAAGLQIIATVGHGGTPMADAPLEGPTLLMLGSEGQGLPSSVLAAADHRVSIPMTPPVESLNVAVAAALLVYEARRQRIGPGTKGANGGTKDTMS